MSQHNLLSFDHLYSLDCGIMEVYTLGSMVPMGGGSSGLVKLRSGWVGLTQAVGMVRLLPAWASSAAAVAGAPGIWPTPGTCSTGGAEEPGRSGAGCWGGGCCWRRGLVEESEGIAEDERWREKRGENNCLEDEKRETEEKTSNYCKERMFMWRKEKNTENMEKTNSRASNM